MEVQGVGSMVQFQQAILDEVRSGIHVLQEPGNQMAGEVTDLFVGIRAKLEAQSKKIVDNGLQIFAQKRSIQAIQKSVGILSKKVDEVTTVVATITQSLKTIPTKQEMQRHKITMEESLNTMAEVNTGLTMAMEQYKFSDSTPLGGQQGVAGPSQPYVHPERRASVMCPSMSSLRDTGSEYLLGVFS
jgi:hypothetical protein